MFSTDRLVLPLEPALFRLADWPQQTLAAGTASVAGVNLSAPAADFVAARVQPGHVVLLGGEDPLEVVAVPSATTLTVSLVRITPDDDPLPCPACTDTPFRITTFDPQHRAIGQVILARLGAASEDEVTAGDVLPLASAAGVVAQVYRALSAGAVDPRSNAAVDDWPATKARLYEVYFRTLLRQARSVRRVNDVLHTLDPSAPTLRRA